EIERQFTCQPRPQRRERGTVLEGAVVQQGQARAQAGTELPVARLRHGAEHLELAAGDSTFGERRRVERLEVHAATDEDTLDPPALRERLDERHSDPIDTRAKAQLDTVGACKPAGDRADRLARVHVQLDRAPESAGQTVQLNRGALRGYVRRAEQRTQLARFGCGLQELHQHILLILVISQMQRARGSAPEASLGADRAPDLATAQRTLEEGPGRLADR